MITAPGAAPAGKLKPAQRAFLEEVRFGALATLNEDGSPHLTVMWYLLDGDEILVNTARGRVKPHNLEHDARVSLVVFEGYRFVRVSGRAREAATGAQAHADIRRLAVRYQGEAAAAGAMARFQQEERVSYRFRIAAAYASADFR